MSFQFHYEPKFEIQDERVTTLDKKRTQLNRSYLRLEDEEALSLNTIVSIETTIRKLKSISSRLKKADLPKFDSLVLTDIVKNLEILDAHNKYFDRCHRLSNSELREIDLHISPLINGIFGPASYSKILRAANKRSFPHFLIDNESDLNHDSNYQSIEYDFLSENRNVEPWKTIMSSYRKNLIYSKNFVQSLFIKLDILKPHSEIDFSIGFSPSNERSSCWDSDNLTAFLDPESIICYRKSDNGDLEFSRELANATLAHEIYHGLEEALSTRSMPPGLCPTNKSFLNFLHGPKTEGGALLIEAIAFDIMKSDSESLKLTRENVHRLNLTRQCFVPNKLHQIAYDIYYAQERAGEAKETPEALRINALKKLAQLTGIKRYYTDPNKIGDRSFDETLRDMVYFFGNCRTQSLIKDMKNKEIPKDIQLNALMTGIWCDQEAQRKFIYEVYIPKIMS